MKTTFRGRIFGIYTTLFSQSSLLTNFFVCFLLFLTCLPLPRVLHIQHLFLITHFSCVSFSLSFSPCSLRCALYHFYSVSFILFLFLYSFLTALFLITYNRIQKLVYTTSIVINYGFLASSLLNYQLNKSKIFL